MLLLKSIEICNFACFEHVAIDVSSDSDRPLTVLRAENGSGKTTFLRALRWAFYGEPGLPGSDPANFSVHPAWWLPDEEGIDTKITLRFVTDGSTRFEEVEAGQERTYQLSRSVTTVARDAVKEEGPSFRRRNESLTLMQKMPDGGWESRGGSTEDVERTVDLLLPWGLRDFFFLDADEATDFVGGRENNPLPKKEVVKKTTGAINELLGLGVVEDTISRIRDVHDKLQREVSKASGDRGLQELQGDLDDARAFVENRTGLLDTKREQLSDLEDREVSATGHLERELREHGAHDELEKRLKETREQLGLVKDARNRTLVALADSLKSRDFLAGLFARAIVHVRDELVPLHQQGLIPLTHVPFVQERLRTGLCVCGAKLEEGSAARESVESLLTESMEQEEQANLLGKVHDICGNCLAELRSSTPDWSQRQADLRADLGDFDGDLSDLEARREQLDGRVRNIDKEAIQALRGELDSIQTQKSRLIREISTIEAEVEPKQAAIASLEKKVAGRQKREQTAQDRRRAADLAQLIGDVLERSYERIQREQVADLSVRMNTLFHKMAANVRDEEFEESEQRATVRMIAEVGVREVPGTHGAYEIYAKNAHGRTLPPTEINGASRRVLALSFILALCVESRTETVLVADSLLNMMSGTVLSNTLEATAQTSRQPVLLLTRQDLAEDTEIALVSQYAGATYTLTGQWQAAEDGGGDVVRRHVPREVSLCCDCGPRKFCDICEREGDPARVGWSRKEANVMGSI